MVAKERKLSKGARAPAPPAAAADSKYLAIANWLRNEKKSGLYTKEAVQYEKVRRLHSTALLLVVRALALERACSAVKYVASDTSVHSSFRLQQCKHSISG